jgi:hypothetical protein
MFERLKNLYTGENQRRALDFLRDPSAYPALPKLDRWHMVLQLYVFHSFHPYISWTLYRSSQGIDTVRRMRYDFIADHHSEREGLTPSEPTTFGADAFCPQELVSTALTSLSQLCIPAYDSASSLGLDGVTFGFRRESSSQSLEFSWWSHPPAGCEGLAEWHYRITDSLEAALPAHTDQFRLLAIRP